MWDASGHRTVCSWFGFLLRVRKQAPFTRTQFVRHLEGKKIGNRMLFGGNLLRQPVFAQLRKQRPESMRVIGNLEGADQIMNEAVFIGTYPGLTREMLDYVIETICTFANSSNRS